MIDTRLAERGKRRDIVQVRGCIQDSVNARYLLRSRKLLRELVVAHRMRPPPRRMLQVRLCKPPHGDAPVAAALDGGLRSVGSGRDRGEAHERESSEQRDSMR